MIVETVYEERKKLDFPCLMIDTSTNLIILASSINELKTNFAGTCLQPGSSGHSIGGFFECWPVIGFQLYKGTITLANEL